jgi:hypothetical protein
MIEMNLKILLNLINKLYKKSKWNFNLVTYKAKTYKGWKIKELN